MKKLSALGAGLGYLLITSVVFAQTAIPINIAPPNQGINPFVSIGSLLSSALTIVFIIAAIIVLFMLVIGAFQWILSGGDKEKVAGARNRITHALIGLVILALAFLITRVAGQMVNIDILDLKNIPVLGQCDNPKKPVFNPTTGLCDEPALTPTPTP